MVERLHAVHETTWNFGDAQPTEPGTVEETHEPPLARGTSTVRHAWCDDGTYTVSLRVRDGNGGMAVDTRTVRVRNVAPTVDAGPDMYAYPCTVLTLSAMFTDPGWCDRHTAVWDFGDCSSTRPATIEETHEPPVGAGTAVASHVYEACGTYHVVCTVSDDDGGVGRDALVATVTDVANRRFEDGYRELRVGRVANEWTPYREDGKAAEFVAEEFVVRAGRRAQGLRVAPGGRAGLWQRVGANPGWCYEVGLRYSTREGVGGVRLGVDPTGGTDGDGADVVWSSSATPHGDGWAALTVRAQATAGAITVLLKAAAADRELRAWFDEVDLLAIQPYCPVKPRPAEPAPAVCASFRGDEPGSVLPTEFVRAGFTIRALDQQPLPVAAGPGGVAVLVLRLGVLVDLPSPAGVVRVALWNQGGDAVRLRATDDTGVVVAGEAVPPTDGRVVVELRAPRIVRLQATSRAAEGAVEEICAWWDVERDG